MSNVLRANPSLQALEVLVGEWDLQVSRASFLPDLSATADGHVSIGWLEGGAYLVVRQGEAADVPSSRWVIGCDESSGTYSMLYSDTRGVSRIYQMSLDQGVWRIWREAPGFSQRFVGTFADDGRRVYGSWEYSEDGEHWEHDFDLTYVKRRPAAHPSSPGMILARLFAPGLWPPSSPDGVEAQGMLEPSCKELISATKHRNGWDRLTGDVGLYQQQGEGR